MKISLKRSKLVFVKYSRTRTQIQFYSIIYIIVFFPRMARPVFNSFRVIIKYLDVYDLLFS